MKTKTINRIISAKFNQFKASITDETVRDIVDKNTIITGGCIVSMLLNEEVNDFDMYFRTEGAALTVAKYYCAKFAASNEGDGLNIEAVSKNGRVTISVHKSENVSVAGEAPEDEEEINNIAEFKSGTGVIEDADNQSAAKLEEGVSGKKGDDYRPLFLSSNAITLSAQVQLIIRFYGEPEAIHGNYDFVHCTNYWTSWGQKVVLNKDALEAILTKELRYVGSRYPICSIIRTRKFLAKGWTINAGQFVKMAWQVSELDLTNITVLKDQLVGVDSAYFSQLISALSKKAKEDKTDGKPTSIDGSYLMTLVDRIF